MGFRAFLAAGLTVALLAGGVLVGTAGAAGGSDASQLRVASPEAKQACKSLKQKAKKKKGKARAKAMAKYRKCLKNYDDSADDGGDGGGDGGGEIVTPTDPKVAAQALIENHEFYRPFAGTYSSGEELWRFCSGTYFRRYTSSSDVGVTEYHDSGSWSMNSATETTAGGSTAYSARIQINGTFDGNPATGEIGVAVSPDTSQSLINSTGGDNWREFIRRAPTGGC